MQNIPSSNMESVFVPESRSISQNIRRLTGAVCLAVGAQLVVGCDARQNTVTFTLSPVSFESSLQSVHFSEDILKQHFAEDVFGEAAFHALSQEAKLELYVEHFGQALEKNPDFPLEIEIQKLLPQLTQQQKNTLANQARNHWKLVTDVHYIDYASYPDIIYKNGQPFTQFGTAYLSDGKEVSHDIDMYTLYTTLSDSLYYVNGQKAFDHTNQYWYYPDGSLREDHEKKYWPEGQVAIKYETLEMWDKNGIMRKDRFLNDYNRDGHIEYVSNFDPDSGEDPFEMSEMAYMDDDNEK